MSRLEGTGIAMRLLLAAVAVLTATGVGLALFTFAKGLLPPEQPIARLVVPQKLDAAAPVEFSFTTLDRLQAKIGGADFQVVTLSIDRGGVSVVKQFYEELGLKSFGIYVDQSGQA